MKKVKTRTKTLLGKRSRKERAKKFVELEAEESDNEELKEITEADLKNGKFICRVCILNLF